MIQPLFLLFMHDEVPTAGVRELLSLMLGLRRGLRVHGDSMSPALRSGEKILIDPHATIRVGDIVAAHHPYISSTKLVKRLVAVDTDGQMFLAGDNTGESTDSRSFGKVGRDLIIGKVIARL